MQGHAHRPDNLRMLVQTSDQNLLYNVKVERPVSSDAGNKSLKTVVGNNVMHTVELLGSFAKTPVITNVLVKPFKNPFSVAALGKTSFVIGYDQTNLLFLNQGLSQVLKAVAYESLVNATGSVTIREDTMQVWYVRQNSTNGTQEVVS